MAEHQSGQWIKDYIPQLSSAVIAAIASVGIRKAGPSLGLDWSPEIWNIVAIAAWFVLSGLCFGLWRLGGALLRLAKRRLNRVTSSGTKLTIVLAALEDDPGFAHTHHVERTLRSQFGGAVEIIRSSDCIAVKEPSVEKQKKQAATLLTKHGADVAIWGTHYSDNKLIELNFLGKGQAQESGDRYSLDDKLHLKDDFGADAGAQIAIQATLIAAPAFDDGHYVVDLLRPAVARLSHLVKNPPASLTSDDRGRIFFSFAVACQRIGEQAGDNGALAKAIAAYRQALNSFPQERVPLQWAATQNNLGTALRNLGERENNTTRLEEAVVAYRAALEERTRERVPLQWAMTQNNLGNALRILGERENSTARLEEAVTAFRDALKEFGQKRVLLQWAMTQNNLGNALYTLGERENDTKRLEEAVEAYRAALEERTRERVPLQWAGTQNNLGNALRSLGERENSTARLEEAVKAYRAALEERTRDRVPLDWAGTQNNLGVALQALGEREDGTVRLEEAVAAFKAALEEWTQDHHPRGYGMATRNLAAAEKLLAERRGGC